MAHLNNGSGRFLGFDPNLSKKTGTRIEFLQKYFEPLIDLEVYAPDLLIMRHVLEHLEDPTDFLEQLALASLSLNKNVYFFAETPCIDIAVNTGRIVDFFYEHPSQFTKKSFSKLMQIGGIKCFVNTDYGGEVVNGLIKLSVDKSALEQKRVSSEFSVSTTKNKEALINLQKRDTS